MENMHTEGVEAFKMILSDPRNYSNCCRLKPAHKVKIFQQEFDNKTF